MSARSLLEAVVPPSKPIPIAQAVKGAYWMDRSGNLYPTKTPRFPSVEHNQWAAQALGQEFVQKRDFREELQQLGWTRISAMWNPGLILIDTVDLTPAQLKALRELRDTLDEVEGCSHRLVRAYSDGRESEMVESKQPDPHWLLTVQQPQGGIPGYTQIDKVDPSGASRESLSLEAFAAEGYPVPDVSRLATGQYRLGQLRTESRARPTWKQAKEYEASSKGVYDPENVRFREYHLSTGPRDGQVTVELDRDRGYRIRNVFVAPQWQRQGLATEIYRALGAESRKVTGKPLRSSNFTRSDEDPTSLSPEGHALWQKLPANQIEQHYELAESRARTLIEAQSFRDWFAGSKVVDAQGRPLRVYHGTNQAFQRFTHARKGNATRVVSAKDGFFFTDSPEVAHEYADYAAKQVVANVATHEKEVARLQAETERLEQVARRTRRPEDWAAFEQSQAAWEDLEIGAVQAEPEGQNIIPVYLQMLRPYEPTERATSSGAIAGFMRDARRAGHDGVILRDIRDSPGNNGSSTQYIVFKTSQIRSAIGALGEATPIYHGSMFKGLKSVKDLKPYRHHEKAGRGVSFSRDSAIAQRFAGMYGPVLKTDAEGLRLYPLSAVEQVFMRRENGRALSTLHREGYDGVDFANSEAAYELHSKLRRTYLDRGWEAARVGRFQYNPRDTRIPSVEREVFVFAPSLSKLNDLGEAEVKPPRRWLVTIPTASNLPWRKVVVTATSEEAAWYQAYGTPARHFRLSRSKYSDPRVVVLKRGSNGIVGYIDPMPPKE